MSVLHGSDHKALRTLPQGVRDANTHPLSYSPRFFFFQDRCAQHEQGQAVMSDREQIENEGAGAERSAA